jgi:molecular chaperone DnaJ
MNPYEALGVAKNATDAEIKAAYRKLVMKYHPDKNAGDKAAEEKFKQINNAFDILKDPQKKAAYDQYGAAAFAGGNGASARAGGFEGNPFGDGFEFNFGGGRFSNMDDVMDEFMRSFGMGGRQSGPAEVRGRDLLHDIEIDLRDAYAGKTETIKFVSNVRCERCNGNGTADGKQAQTCKTCRGSGTVHRRNGIFMSEAQCPECNGLGRIIKNKCASCDSLGVMRKNRTLEVKIPAGVHDGARLRLAGQGEAGMFGASAGDFYIDIHIRPDEIFKRVDDNLYMQKIIPFATLALGGETDIYTISDKKMSLKIPAGTQIEERLRMKGLGMPKAGRNGEFGDLYVEIKTSVPKNLSAKQKKALEEFAGTETKKKGWL